MNGFGPSAVVCSIVAVLVAVSGCTVAGSSEPIAIDPESLPAELRSASDISTTTTQLDGSQSVAVFYVRNDEATGASLERIIKPAETGNRQQAIKALLANATSEDERADNLINHLGQYSFQNNNGTQVPLELRGAAADDDDTSIFVIDLNGPIDFGAGNVLTQAFAQLVFTATENPRVRSVRIEVNGEPVPIPVENDLVPEADRDDYPLLLATLDP